MVVPPAFLTPGIPRTVCNTRVVNERTSLLFALSARYFEGEKQDAKEAESFAFDHGKLESIGRNGMPVPL